MQGRHTPGVAEGPRTEMRQPYQERAGLHMEKDPVRRVQEEGHRTARPQGQAAQEEEHQLAEEQQEQAQLHHRAYRTDWRQERGLPEQGLPEREPLQEA